MPFYLKQLDVSHDVKDCRSALIVVCRFCPAASQAARESEPYMEVFQRGIKTGCFEELLRDLKSSLENRGIRTSVVYGNLINFIICMWTEKQRTKLKKLASEYDAVVVLACEAGYENIRDMLETEDCKVIQGMEAEGIFDVGLRLTPPGNIYLDLNSVTPINFPDSGKGSNN